MNKPKKSIMLYDAGGLIIFIMLFGIPFGSIFDYLWNLLVFSVALSFLPVVSKIKLSKGRRFLYILFITLLGIIIDWAYFELTWDTHFGKTGLWMPAMSQGLQFVWMLLPIAMLWLVNFALSYAYLKLERKPAVILGGVMALFTAPWLLPTIPYLMGWVI
ncbi:MAG: hypothetical protein PHU23_09395 [Dehalococcoidales bacterium]|nr:hypothetical protein [Dehalococcoidales bacterium]